MEEEKSEWLDFLRPKGYKGDNIWDKNWGKMDKDKFEEQDNRYYGLVKIINIENGDYDFFICGRVKNFLYTENKKYSKEIIDLFDEEVSAKYSLKNYFLKDKKGIVKIPRRSKLRLHFKALISFNEENKKIWTESLGKNEQEILESLKKNIQNTKFIKEEFIKDYLTHDCI